jgi:hypothetical protein
MIKDMNKIINVGDQVQFTGTTTEVLSGRVVKVNKVTITVKCDQDGCVWGVRRDKLIG